MNLKLLLTLAGLCLCTSLSSQIKIGDNPQNLDATSVLELESNDRVLVITRISEAQMNSLAPLAGAMVYNNDAQCVFYFDGASWINLCDSLQLNFTTDPIVNTASTIVITENGDVVNFEVGEISSENILDFSINSNDIQNNSITADKLASDSVGSEELQDNTVTDAEIDYNLVTLSDFLNDAGFITAANIVSGNANNAITDNGGAFYDDSQIISDVAANTAAIAADNDDDQTNELQILSLNADQLTITGGNTITIPTADGSDTNIQGGTNINVTGIGTVGNPYIINNTFTEVDGSISNELQDLQFNPGTNILTLTTPATPGNQVDLSALAGGGGSTELADQITIVGTGALGDEFEVGDGSIGSIKIIDGTIMPVDLANNSVETAKILDANVTPVKIAPSAINNQVLTTIANTVVWADVTAGGNPTAADVTFVPSGNTTSTDVQAAIEELQTEVDGISAGGAANPNDELNTNFAVNAGNLEITDAGGTFAVPLTSIDTDDQDLLGATLSPANVLQIDIENGLSASVDLSSLAGGTVVTDGVTIQGDGTVGNEIQVVDGGINTLQLADDAVSTIKIPDNNVTPDKISEGATGQVLTTDAAGDVVWAAATAGAVATDGVTVQGDGTVGNEIKVVDGGINTLQLADDAVSTIKILDNNVTPDKLEEGAAGEVLTTDIAGDVVWAPGGAHLGTPNSIFFADGATGLPVDAGNLFYWDQSKKGGTGALYIGIDGNTESPIAKVHIRESNLSADKFFPLQLQNAAQGITASVGMLFSLDQNNADSKGAIVYERDNTAGPGTGDFHFLQNTSPTDDFPSQVTDAVMTIRSNGNVGIGTKTPSEKLHIVGNLRLENQFLDETNSPGNAGDVLTATATGTVWTLPSAGAVATDGTSITGNGTVGNELAVIANGITATEIADGAVSGGPGGVITDNSITASDLDADSVDSSEIRIDAVGTSEIADGSIATVDIADANVTTAKIAPGADGEILSTVAGAVTWTNPAVALKAKVNAASGAAGAYTIPVTMPNANYIINVSVEENNPGNPIIIQITGQTAANFSVQIYEAIAGVFTATNANWHYTILNP